MSYLRTPLTSEEMKRRAAVLVQQTSRNNGHSNGELSGSASLGPIYDHDLWPDTRTADQENSYNTLQRAFLSWERTLQSALPENRLEVLQNALRELLSVAEPAAAVSDVLDLATNHGAIFGLDTDAVQRVLVKTRETKPALGMTINDAARSHPLNSDRLRPLDLKSFLQLSIKPREMLLDPILPEKGLAML